MSTAAATTAMPETTALRLLVIAHNHPDLFPGGAEHAAYRLFQHFKAQPHMRASFLAATDAAHSPVYSGTPLTAYEGRDDEMLLQAGAFDYFMQSLRNSQALTGHFTRYLEETRPDIIHLHHTLRLGMELLAVIKRVLPHCKIVYTLHDFIPLCHRDGQMVRRTDESLCEAASAERCHQCFPEISVTRFALREHFIRSHFDRVDAFISPSHFLAQRFIDWGIPEEKMQVIANGMEEQTSAPHRKIPKRAPRNRFAYFGQITPYKGLSLLCEAAKILREAHGEDAFHIDIHGHVGVQTEAFQQHFHDALETVKDCVTWHGRYPADTLPDRIAGADWVIVPSSWWENAPLVIDEAFAHQRPVICADVGGMAEKVTHRINGLHFRSNSAQGLAATMAEAMESPEAWQKLARGITPPTTLTDSAAQHQALYEALG